MIWIKAIYLRLRHLIKPEPPAISKTYQKVKDDNQGFTRRTF